MSQSRTESHSQPTTPRRRGRRSEVSREAWIAAGLEELGRHGAGALRLDRLCKRLEITKGSFYWHFSSREEFVQRILESWEQRDTLALIDLVESGGGGAEDRLRALFHAANSGRVDFAAEQAIRHMGQHDASVRRMLHRVDLRRLGYLETLFAQLFETPDGSEAAASLYYGLVFGEAMTYRREDRVTRRSRQSAALDLIFAGAPRRAARAPRPH